MRSANNSRFPEVDIRVLLFVPQLCLKDHGNPWSASAIPAVHVRGQGRSPRDDRGRSVPPLVEDGVVVAVANAHLGDLDADILGPRGAPGEFEGHQLPFLVARNNANGLAACVICQGIEDAGFHRRWADTAEVELFKSGGQKPCFQRRFENPPGCQDSGLGHPHVFLRCNALR